MLIGVIAEELLIPNAIREPASAQDEIIALPLFMRAIAEAAAAEDMPTTGVVFAALIDDSASVGEYIDALLGELMLEAATAVDSIDSGSIYAAAIDEATTASDDVSTTAAVVALTTTSIAGPLLMLDTTFPASSLTVIDVGR